MTASNSNIKVDQLGDYLHVDSSTGYKTPLKVVGDGMLDGHKSSQEKLNMDRKPGLSGIGTSPYNNGILNGMTYGTPYSGTGLRSGIPPCGASPNRVIGTSHSRPCNGTAYGGLYDRTLHSTRESCDGTFHDNQYGGTLHDASNSNILHGEFYGATSYSGLRDGTLFGRPNSTRKLYGDSGTLYHGDLYGGTLHRQCNHGTSYSPPYTGSLDGKPYETSPVTRRDNQCSPSRIKDAFYYGNCSLSNLDLLDLSCESDIEPPSMIPNDERPRIDDVSEQSCSTSIVTYLHNLLGKSEVVQNTLHSKVKDAYKIIQNQTEHLLKNEYKIKSLGDKLEQQNNLYKKLLTRNHAVEMENNKLNAINQKNLTSQDVLGKRFVELQKDFQAICTVHNALQSENADKQLVLEKTLNDDLHAFENERTVLMKECQSMSNKVTELEKCTEDLNMKLEIVEKENSCLCSKKQELEEECQSMSNEVTELEKRTQDLNMKLQIVGKDNSLLRKKNQQLEEEEKVYCSNEAYEQLKVELAICQELCEKLIVEKSVLIQRQRKVKNGCNKRDMGQEEDGAVQCNGSLTTANIIQALSSLPFLKDLDINDNGVDVTTKIKEHVNTLEKQVDTCKNQLEECQKLLSESKDEVAKQNDSFESEKAKIETARNKITNEKEKLERQLGELKKDQAKWKVDQSELTLIITEAEMEKKHLEKLLEEKDNELSLLQNDTQKKLEDSDNTISLLEEKLDSLASELHCLKDQPLQAETVEKRDLGSQTTSVPKMLQRRHSEGCVQSNCRGVGRQCGCVVPSEVSQNENSNLVSSQEHSEKESLITEKELEEIIQHFKAAFDEQMTRGLKVEKANSEARERELLFKLEKQQKECQEREEHSLFVSEAYQKLQGELETLWQEKDSLFHKCESLEFERNQLREQVEELCRSHSEDEKVVDGNPPTGTKSPSKPQSPRRDKDL